MGASFRRFLARVRASLDDRSDRSDLSADASEPAAGGHASERSPAERDDLQAAAPGSSPPATPPAATTPPPGRLTGLTERVHNWLPIGIVIVSVFAATMGGLAAVADEHATHSDELGRQDFVTQQSALLFDLQQVDSDLRLFGTYEQYSLLGQRLLADGAALGGSEGQALTREGQGNIDLARGLGSQMSSLGYSPAIPDNFYNSSTKAGVLQADGTYRPGSPPDARSALAFKLSGDSDLVTLAPNRLHAEAQAQRDTGVELVGVAALFIAGLVFFTFAALSHDRNTLWFSACGLAVALVAVVLFPIVQFT